MDADDLVLTADGAHGDVRVAIDVQRGGRIAHLDVGGHHLLIDPGDRDPTSVNWGSYPMAPWAGRIRSGRFRFFDRDHQLPINQQDGDVVDLARQHALHGTVFSQPWSVEERSATAVTMTCRLDHATSGWPWPGIAHQTIEVHDGQLRCDLSVDVDHDVSTAPFPAVIGWHPWFAKPDALHFHPDAMYETDHVGLPTGALIAPPVGPWDDCFVNTAPITLEYQRDVAAMVTVSSDCDHWVVFDKLPFGTCVEPQSGPANAFNLSAALVTATHPLRRTMNISW